MDTLRLQGEFGERHLRLAAARFADEASDAFEKLAKSFGLDQVYDQVQQRKNIGRKKAFGKKSKGSTSSLASCFQVFTELDIERFGVMRRRLTEIDSSFGELLQRFNEQRHETISQKLAEDAIDTIENALTALQQLSQEPQSDLPDVLVHMWHGRKSVAYSRLPASRIFYVTELAHQYPMSGLQVWSAVFSEHISPTLQLENDWCTAADAKRTISAPVRAAEMCELRAYLYQARALIGSDDTGLSDPYCRIVLLHHSEKTEVCHETLNPVWNETVTIQNIPIVAVDNGQLTVVVEVYDHDDFGDDEVLGSCFITPSRRTAHVQGPQPLEWFEILRHDGPCGELLASFELISADQLTSAEPLELDEERDVFAVPRSIQPRLRRYRMEVVFWGVRNLKKFQMSSIERPKIELEVSGVTLSSGIIQSASLNPNFPEPLQSFELDLPEQEIYCPPLSIRCYDYRHFGRVLLVGSCSVSNVKQFLRELMPVSPIGSQPIKTVLHLDDGLESDGALSDYGTFAGENAANEANEKDKPSDSKKEQKKEPAATEDELDWWTKYYASVEALAAETQANDTTETSKSKGLFRSNKPKKSFSAKFKKLTSMKRIKAKLKRRDKAQEGDAHLAALMTGKVDEKAPKLVIYKEELEQLTEFEGFEDQFKTFQLYRGKQDDDSDANRQCGEFKGLIALYPDAGENATSPENEDSISLPKSHLLPEIDGASLEIICRVYVIRALDLRPVDTNGKADPYLVVKLGKHTIKDKDHYVSKQLNPIFGRSFEFKATLPADSLLTIQVFDWDLIGSSDLIGETKIDIENRFFSRHRASCGLALKYDTSGYNAWRDAELPSQILKTLCSKAGLDPPSIDVDSRQCIVNSARIRVPLKIEVKGSEDIALYALHQWHQIPGTGNCALVPEHIETRQLWHPDKPDINQGRIEVWVDLFPMPASGKADSLPPPIDITPRKPKGFEMRCIIWNTDEIPLEDDSMLSGEKCSDIYVKGWLTGPDDTQSTDVHYRSLTGEGNFNWRFVYPFQYLTAEKKIVIRKKESILSWDESEVKIPPRLNLQVWDADNFSADDFLGSVVLDLNNIPRPARDSKHCRLEMVTKPNEHLHLNFFAVKRLRGWYNIAGLTLKNKNKKRFQQFRWPFTRTNEETEQLEMCGKVEAELILLTADEAEAKPVGKGRDEPEPLEPPKRPETSFMWFTNPFKSLYHIIWKNYKWLIIKSLIMTILIALFCVFVYNLPNYMAMKMVGAG